MSSPEGSLAAALEATSAAGVVVDESGAGLALGPVTPDRVRIEVCTSAGPAAVVEFRVRMETVEVACSGASCGVFDRWALRRWLAEPTEPLEVDEVSLCIDRMIDSSGRVAITLPRAHVHQWTLSPSDRTALTGLV